MSDEIKVVYGFCQDNCKYPVYTKEDVIGLLQYVIEHNELPSDIVNGNYDSTQGLVAVNSVVEQNKGKAMQFFLGTQAEYDAYTGDKTNLFSVITDDQTKQSIMDTLSQHASSINGMIDGKISVNKASNANKINDIEITKDENGVLRVGDTIIPQKKLLWSGKKNIWSDSTSTALFERCVEIFADIEEFTGKKIFEAVFSGLSGEDVTVLRVIVDAYGLSAQVEHNYGLGITDQYLSYSHIVFVYNKGKLKAVSERCLKRLNGNVDIEPVYVRVTEIYEVIE